MRAVLEIFYFCFQFLQDKRKVTITENITFADSVSGIRPPDCSKLAKNPKNDNNVTIFRHDVIVNFFDVVLFLLSSLVTSPSFMSISSLFLELWQFSFVRDWPEIYKLEITQSEFCPISEDGGELWIPNLAQMSLNAAKYFTECCKIPRLQLLRLLSY